MSKLALKGGKPVLGEGRLLGGKWPVFGRREEELLLEVLHSGKWWRGAYERAAESKVGQFEDAFAKYQQAAYGIAVTNGTQALECALKSAGVGAGDEVIVPALTFVATATAVALVNAVPVFVDVDPESYDISPRAIQEAITEDTRAVIPVHNGGYPADMDRIMAIADEHDLTVIEDCAHAHGSEWDGRRVGSIGHFGCFSFQMGKTLTCGEGGIVLTNDQDLAEKAYSFHHIGRLSGRPFYEFHRIASNLRMTEFQAAVLLGQLERLDEQVEKREANASYLAAGLEDIDGVAPLNRDPRVTRWCFYYWNFKYIQDEFEGIPREKFREAVAAEGVGIGIGAHGAPIYTNPVFQRMEFGTCPFHTKRDDYRNVHCPEAERIYETEALSLSHAVFLGEKQDMDLILEAIRKVREHTDELRD